MVWIRTYYTSIRQQITGWLLFIAHRRAYWQTILQRYFSLRIVILTAQSIEKCLRSEESNCLESMWSEKASVALFAALKLLCKSPTWKEKWSPQHRECTQKIVALSQVWVLPYLTKTQSCSEAQTCEGPSWRQLGKRLWPAMEDRVHGLCLADKHFPMKCNLMQLAKSLHHCQT